MKRISVIVVLLVLVVRSGIFGYRKTHSVKKTEGDTIVKENVKVITEETDKQPVSVKEDSIIFNSNPRYKEGDVIVSGITSFSPEGYIRKVTKIEKQGGKYIIKTEPAVLTDVFEKAHIYKRIKLTENSNEATSYIVENTEFNSDVTQFHGQLCKENDNDDDDEMEYMYSKSFEETEDPVTISGEAGISIWVEVEIDIAHGEIECGIAARTKEGAKAELECSKSYSKELEKNLLKKKLPHIEFAVAGVPIVVTNQLEIDAGAEMNLEGNIDTSYELTAETTLGFQYSSKTGKVKEIKKIDSNSDGLVWSTVSISGDASVGPTIHLITKLYGASGADISAGISGKIEGEAKASTKEDLDGYAGSLDLSLNPEIQGEVIVDTPIFDKNLLTQNLFEKELEPLWSKHWESSANWQEDLNWQEKDNSEKSENQTKTVAYSNEYFEVEVPESWEGHWSVTERDNTMNGIPSTVYIFSHDSEEEEGGAAEIYVLDMSDTSRPLSHYGRMLPDYCEDIGVTSFGSYDVLMMEVANGFFYDGGGKITLK